MPKGFTQPDWLVTAAQETPDAPALLQGDNAWTYAELSFHAGALADSLGAAGVVRGDRVGVLLPNCFEYAALVWGIWRRGATVMPLNMRLTAGEVADQVQRAGCKIVVLDASLPAEYFTSLPAQPFTIEPPDRNASRIDFIDMGSLPIASHQPVTADSPSPEFTRLDVAAILFTSGTSGTPKGAQLTFNNLYYAAMASTLRLGNPPGDRWLLTLPLYHVGGLSMLVRACLCRAAVIVMDRFTPDALIAAAAQHQATLVSLVPTMLYRVLSTQYSVPRTQNPPIRVPSTEHPVLSTQNPVPSTEYPVLSTQNPELRTQNLPFRAPSTEHRARPFPRPFASCCSAARRPRRICWRRRRHAASRSRRPTA